ncbi:MAG: histidine kinase, partial [Acidobacteria bacterium]|nr:histidine kinase [Acidobacteriota bacterium]
MTDLDQTPWRQLLEARTAEEFCLGWLDLQSRMIGGVSGGVVVFEAPETGSFAPVAFWPRGLKERETLAGVVERVIRERKGIVLRSEADREPDAAEDPRLHLAYPVWVGDRLSGVAALQIAPRPQIQLQPAMRLLQWGVAWLQNWILRQAAEPDAHVRKRLTAALELAALVLEEEGFQAAATAFVTELATRLRCDRVSLGFVKGGQVRVRALSHSAQFGKHMNLIRAIGLAMGESADQRAILR